MATSLKNDEVAQNDLNIKLKGQPWYVAYLQQIGQNPSKVQLTGAQRKELQNIAAQHGVVLPQGVQFDPSGNVNEQHGFAGQPGWAKALEIGGALAPIAAFAVPALMGAGTMTAAGAAAAPAATEAGIFGATGAGAMGTIGSLIGGGSTINKISDALRAGGKAIGAATTAAGQTQLENESRDANANAMNISGEAAYQSELQSAARTEADQREAARKNLYRASVAHNPTSSPFNPQGPPKLSPELMTGLSDLEKEAMTRLATGSKYDQATMPGPTPYKPYVPKTRPSTMQTVGNWLAPTLSTFGSLGQLFR